MVIQQTVRTLWDHTLAHAWMDLLSIHEKGYAWVRNVDFFPLILSKVCSTSITICNKARVCRSFEGDFSSI